MATFPPRTNRGTPDMTRRPPDIGGAVPLVGLESTELDENRPKRIPPTEKIRRGIREAVNQRIDEAPIECSFPRDEIRRIAQETLRDLLEYFADVIVGR
ncbi:MAG: hypothetical protein H8E44_18255 [Planctomycetes bacterium]|nr:hypothetical protein [Planctomycetota bacterium]